MSIRGVLLERLSASILNVERSHPLRVGIDGVDTAGKTYLANELAHHLQQKRCGVIRASIDGFHHPRQIRYRRGTDSPEGYYYDSFNYDLLKECLLIPLGPLGDRLYRTRAFDFRSDQIIACESIRARVDDILLFDGVFLFRPELSDYWDLKVFVDVSFETVQERAAQRDEYLFRSREEILNRYHNRYIPGQKIYLETVRPHLLADVLIDNNAFARPFIILPEKGSDT